MIKAIINYFDKLEDRIRHRLSKYPMLYAFVAGIGVVLFWRGVWYLADFIELPAALSLIFSLVLMLLSGTFVSFFIGEQIILSGIKQEKRIDEKTEMEIRKEKIELYHIDEDLESLKKQVAEIKKIIDNAKL